MKTVRTFLRVLRRIANTGLMAIVIPGSILFASAEVVVEVTPPSANDSWIGERMNFAVAVGVKGQFSGATVFDVPQVEGAVILRSSDRPTVSSRKVDGEEYFFQRHEFSLFTQRAGIVEVPSYTVRCGSVAAFGEEPVSYTADVPGFTVEPRTPPDTRPGELVITTSDMVVTETWEPAPAKAKAKARAGDAFRRTITMKAQEFPSMLLPDMPAAGIDGVATYPAQPSMQDATQRGEFIGKRTNEITYVCEKEGSVTFPAIEIRWWDPQRESWESKSFPAVSLEVAANPAFAGAPVEDGGAEKPAKSNPWPIIAGVGVLIAVLAAWFMRKRSPESGETAAFRRLDQACRENDAAGAYELLYAWWSHRSGEPLPRNLLELSRPAQLAIIGESSSWVGTDLLHAARKERKHVRKTSTDVAGLPNLNP